MDRRLVEVVPNFIYWDWQKTAKGLIVYFELPNGRVHSRLVYLGEQNLLDIFEGDDYIVLIVE